MGRDGGAYKKRCEAQVHNAYGVSFHQCTRRAVVTVDGRSWCKQHSPFMAARQAAERAEHWAAESKAAQDAARDRELARKRAAHWPFVVMALAAVVHVAGNSWHGPAFELATRELRKAKRLGWKESK